MAVDQLQVMTGPMQGCIQTCTEVRQWPVSVVCILGYFVKL